jgi:hypothetical protein
VQEETRLSSPLRGRPSQALTGEHCDEENGPNRFRVIPLSTDSDTLGWTTDSDFGSENEVSCGGL